MKALSLLLGLSLMGFFPSVSSAETVYVKYQGRVNLDRFQCNQLRSSFVHRLCYLPEEKYAVVLLKSTYYHYCRLPSDVVDDWLGAGSKGRYYNRRIKGRYDCRLGGVPD